MAPSSLFLLLLQLFMSSALANNGAKVPYLRELPNTGQDWITLENGVEFQPSSDNPLVVDAAPASDKNRMLNMLRSNYNPYSNQILHDSSNTQYDPYSQAWRMLGFYIDCTGSSNGNRRNLNGNDNNNNKAFCQRYLLWAFVRIHKLGGEVN